MPLIRETKPGSRTFRAGPHPPALAVLRAGPAQLSDWEPEPSRLHASSRRPDLFLQLGAAHRATLKESPYLREMSGNRVEVGQDSGYGVVNLGRKQDDQFGWGFPRGLKGGGKSLNGARGDTVLGDRQTPNYDLGIPERHLPGTQERGRSIEGAGERHTTPAQGSRDPEWADSTWMWDTGQESEKSEPKARDRRNGSVAWGGGSGGGGSGTTHTELRASGRGAQCRGEGGDYAARRRKAECGSRAGCATGTGVQLRKSGGTDLRSRRPGEGFGVGLWRVDRANASGVSGAAKTPD